MNLPITWESAGGLWRLTGAGGADELNTQDLLIEEPTCVFTPMNKSEGK